MQPWREERKKIRVGKWRVEAESTEGCGGEEVVFSFDYNYRNCQVIIVHWITW